MKRKNLIRIAAVAGIVAIVAGALLPTLMNL